MKELLQEGIAAYKSGRLEEARRIFAAVVQQYPDSERGWGWMSTVCQTREEQIHCLRQVLRINPRNEKVRLRLAQLEARHAAPHLPLTTVSSEPQRTATDMANYQRRKDGFTATQLLVLLGLGITLVFIAGFAVIYMMGRRNELVLVAPPTNVPILAVSNTPLPTQPLPTATLIPTYAYVPTWTPLPSPTSFVLATLVPPTLKPQQVQNSPAVANPPVGNSSTNCSAELEYAAAMHKYYLDQIDYIHAPLISLYQSWIDDAGRSRDAVALVQAQDALAAEQAQAQAEKNTEKQRYNAEVANINANCR